MGDVVDMVCLCGEPVVKRGEPFRGGWAVAVADVSRLMWQHKNRGGALCPEIADGGYVPSRPVAQFVTVYATTYAPWEEGADERERLGTETVVHPCAGDEYETSIDQAVSAMRYVIEASSEPWQPGSWYGGQPYEHPYSGELEETSYHLHGFTDDQQEEIWLRVKADM